MTVSENMSSNRPYLVRAMYDWICDNGLTPYLLVDARQQGVRVPTHAIKDGQVVLNVAVRAVSELELGNERIRFLARFGGVSQQVDVPLPAVLAIYAQENGQGMMFPSEAQGSPPPAPAEPEKPMRKGPQLRVIK
jgi:stringent starvation protein B